MVGPRVFSRLCWASWRLPFRGWSARDGARRAALPAQGRGRRSLGRRAPVGFAPMRVFSLTGFVHVAADPSLILRHAAPGLDRTATCRRHIGARLASGELMPAPSQRLAVDKLQSLWRALQSQPNNGEHGWRARLGLALASAPPPPASTSSAASAAANDADGPVLRHGAGREEAPRPFPRLHAGGARRIHAKRREPKAAIRSRRWRRDRAPRRRCCASTSSRSTTSPMR